jgi:hypothetical protein
MQTEGINVAGVDGNLNDKTPSHLALLLRQKRPRRRQCWPLAIDALLGEGMRAMVALLCIFIKHLDGRDVCLFAWGFPARGLGF